MREIKFRFWDGTTGNKCMAYTTEDGYITYSSGWKLSLDDAIEENNTTEGYDKPKSLMQHTGLKDKHGVGIYEGDIVKTNFSNMFTGQIVYQEAEFLIKYHSFAESLSKLKRNNWGLEIIGNIYENPELLK